MSTQIKVGLLMLTSFVMLAIASVAVTGLSLDTVETKEISVVFDDVAGLNTGSPVRVAGIKVGQVDRIELQGNQAKVVMAIYEKHAIYDDAVASIKSIGVLGDKFVDVNPGTQGRNQLSNSDEIKRILTGTDLDSLIDSFSTALRDVQSITSAMNNSFGGARGERRFNNILDNIEELTHNVNVVSQITRDKIEVITTQLETFSVNLATITQDNKENIGEIVTNIQQFSNQLNQMALENRHNIQQAVANLNTFSASLSEQGPEMVGNLNRFSKTLATDGEEITGQLKGILAENRQDIRTSVSDFKDTVGGVKDSLGNLKNTMKNLDHSFAKLDRTMGRLESITKKIDEGEGTVGKLINDKKTVEELNEAIENVNKLLGSVDRLRVDIGVHAEYLSKNQGGLDTEGHTKGYLTVKLQPLKDRYYLLQLVSNPRGKRTKTRTIQSREEDGVETDIDEVETEVTEQLQLSAQIVQRFYDTNVKLGLFENDFGVGVEQIFGRNEQYKIALDAWDIGGEFGTHLKASVFWNFHANMFVVAGADDFASTEEDFRDNFIGFGLTFNEDVIKPYLSSLPLGALQ